MSPTVLNVVYYRRNEAFLTLCLTLRIRRLLLKYIFGRKFLTFGLILPAAIFLSFVQSWKAITAAIFVILFSSIGLGTLIAGNLAPSLISLPYKRRSSPYEQANDLGQKLAYQAYFTK